MIKKVDDSIVLKNNTNLSKKLLSRHQFFSTTFSPHKGATLRCIYLPFDPGTPLVPSSPGTPSVPGRPGTPSTPLVPGIPSDPGIPSVPGMPSIP